MNLGVGDERKRNSRRRLNERKADKFKLIGLDWGGFEFYFK